ncbi:MAG: hypothetical protein NC312_12800, partial [Bacteroides fragilis]|nr:hypothetical protein [Bacteroides fragilis]
MKKNIISIITFIFCAAVCANVFAPLSVSASAKDKNVTPAAPGNTDTDENPDLILRTNAVTVRVGYYDNGEPEFQDGFSDDVRKSGYAYDYFQMLARYAGWKYEYVYGSKEEISQMLIDDDIDIMAGVCKTDITLADKVLFSSSDMGLGDGRYFAIRKSNTELLDELNNAMTQIDTVSPKFTIELLQKYFNKTSDLSLTEQEEQWLQQKNTLTFGYTRYHLPFSGQDDDGNPVGLAGELIRQLEEFADIEVVPVCF